MSNSNETTNDVIQFSRIKPKIKNEIIDLLKHHRYGLNISQIVDKLELSRNTVKKYIKALEKESIIKIKTIGRSRICFVRKNYKTRYVKIYQDTFFSFSSSLVKGFEKIAPSLPDPYKFIKQLAREVGEDTKFPKLNTKKPDISTINKQKYLQQITKVSIDFLRLMNEIGDELFKAEIVPKVLDEDTSSLIIRVEHISKKIPHSEYFYYGCAGFCESKLRENFGENISLDVHEFSKKNSCCYFKINISENKS